MTAQMGDIITYKGRRHTMASEPQIIAPAAKFFDIRFIPPHTACWRGYLAEWAVNKDKLFLKSIQGKAEVTDLEAWRSERLALRKRLKQGEISPQENGHLLKEHYKRLTTERKVDLTFLFGSSEPVHATWITGIIRIPTGNIIRYVHMDYFSEYDRNLFLSFKDGMLLSAREEEFGKSD